METGPARVVCAAQVPASHPLRGNAHAGDGKSLMAPGGQAQGVIPELGEGDSGDGDAGAGKWFSRRRGLGQAGA